MNRKVYLSLAILVLAVALVGGATMAWFTDTAELHNTFTAGTLEIDAEDGWEGLGVSETWDNVNPGDCKDKNFTITNIGSKHALIRFKFSGEWGEYVNNAWVYMADQSPDLVTVTAPAGWHEHTDGYWYYTTGPLVPTTGKVEFDLTVCVDGKGTDNDYQGMSYKLDFTVEAIQASNNASGDLWGVDSVYLPVDPETAVNWNSFNF